MPEVSGCEPSNEAGACAPSNGMHLWYRDEGNSDGEPMLLIMGLSSQLIAWPDDFVAALGEAGYRVIRFDNRDCGLSLKVDAPDGLFDPAPYKLADMANDAAGLLDHLGIQEAHVVGASMGGMIAQYVAINHNQKVRSLCSIMSTTGALGVGGWTDEAFAAVTSRPPNTERDTVIEHITWVYRVIGSQTLAKEEEVSRKKLATASYDRMFWPKGGNLQVKAIVAPGQNRTAQLEALKDSRWVPTLVIHGAEDSLINISGGVATHNAVPDSEFLRIETMGHDLPKRHHQAILAAIHANAGRLAPHRV